MDDYYSAYLKARQPMTSPSDAAEAGEVTEAEVKAGAKAISEFTGMAIDWRMRVVRVALQAAARVRREGGVG